MDLLPELDINADIEALMEDDKTEIEDMTVDDISKDLSKEDPPETVDTMFKKNMPVEEVEINEVKPVKKKKEKKPLTEKQRAHLDKIRAKALATRRANAQKKKEAAIKLQDEIRAEKKERRNAQKRQQYHTEKTTHLEKVGKGDMVYDNDDRRLYENEDEVPLSKKKAINSMNQEDDFTRFMSNMDKFMILQEKLEERRKPKQYKNVNKSETQPVKPPPSTPIPIPKPAPVKKLPPPKPHIQKDPYDDWFG